MIAPSFVAVIKMGPSLMESANEGRELATAELSLLSRKEAKGMDPPLV